MLRVAYKADEEQPEKRPKQKPVNVFIRQMEYKHFKKACKANAERIAEIQKYIPGWEPKFKFKG